MDDLRRAVALAEADEQILLNKRTVNLNRYTTQVPYFIVLAALVAIAITAFSYRTVAGEYHQKERPPLAPGNERKRDTGAQRRIISSK